nr:hypothetical protein [Tanacetum cinerariifolium]
MLIRIPFHVLYGRGALHYRTHIGGPCKALTVRNSIRTLPSHRLALRSALLSTTYPPTTSESSTGDSSFESSSGPSHKRCRSPTAIVTSSIHARRALVPSHTDLLPPRKRFRDSISLEDSVEEDIDTNVLEDIEVDATTVEVSVDRDVEARIDACIGMEVDVGIDVEDEVKDEVESNDRGAMEVRVDMGVGIDIPDGMLMPDVVERLEQLIASRKRVGLSDRTRSSERENLKVRALLCIERDWVDSLCRHMVLSQEEFRQVRKDHDDTRRRLGRLELALAAYEATHAANALEAENQSQNDNDSDNRNGGNGNGRNRNGGNGSGENGNGRNENPNENGRGDRLVARECTYQDFMKYQPLNFKGMEGVLGLTRWFEKMETVFHISNCPKNYQVKMVLEEEDQIERYVEGFPDNIQGNVMSAEPMRLQDSI